MISIKKIYIYGIEWKLWIIVNVESAMYVIYNYKVYAVDKANTDENSFFLST